LRLEDTTVTDNHVTGSGGGVAVVNGIATIHRSIIRANSVGILYGTVVGGGVFASDAKLTVTDSTISGNSGPNDNEIVTLGAGIFNGGGELRILNSAITENITPFGGAGGGDLQHGTTLHSEFDDRRQHRRRGRRWHLQQWAAHVGERNARSQ
jgi:hypothetical protein